MRVSRWWRRRTADRPAARCPNCGWHPVDVFGVVHGRHDRRFVGHSPWCPTRLYASLRTGPDIADQWAVLCLWAALSAPLAMPGTDDAWRLMSWSLMQRADQLGVPFPVADDAAELVTGGG